MADLILNNVYYHYPKSQYMVLNGVNAVFKEGTMTSVRGRSGAGKSTLLYLAAGMERPASGTVTWEGKTVTDLTAYRRNVVGIISQSYLLFPTRTVLENVCYPITLKKMPFAQAVKEAERLLNMVGVATELYQRLPEKLSGGEQQRVAIARCLASQSMVIAADEPTGNLDEQNTRNIVELLQRLAHEEKKTVIVVTHDPFVAESADVMLELTDGELKEKDRHLSR